MQIKSKGEPNLLFAQNLLINDFETSIMKFQDVSFNVFTTTNNEIFFEFNDEIILNICK